MWMQTLRKQRIKILLSVGLLLTSCVTTANDHFVFLTEALLKQVNDRWGDGAEQRVRGWDDMMRSGLEDVAATDKSKLKAANDYFNQVRWLSDQEHWGLEDYWATPVETLASNGGDCEDFSIGKYFSLLTTKVDTRKLRITYVKSLTFNQAHMVLTYYESPGAEPYILDNIRGEIVLASKREDLVPVYSFDGESIWLAQGRGQLKTDSQRSLPQWQQVNKRMGEKSLK